jgi:hypothetical protein
MVPWCETKVLLQPAISIERFESQMLNDTPFQLHMKRHGKRPAGMITIHKVQ